MSETVFHVNFTQYDFCVVLLKMGFLRVWRPSLYLKGTNNLSYNIFEYRSHTAL